MDLLYNFPSNLVAFLDFLPPYKGAGLNGQPLPLSYTEEVVGSSPIPPTVKPLDVGDLWVNGRLMVASSHSQVSIRWIIGSLTPSEAKFSYDHVWWKS
jgi:hypothetical protein